MSDKTGYTLNTDSNGHWYLIPLKEENNFQKWVSACDRSKFSDMKKFSYFNSNIIDLPKLVIYDWEEKS